MSLEGNCDFGKLQLFLQPNRDYLSKKPLFLGERIIKISKRKTCLDKFLLLASRVSLN